MSTFLLIAYSILSFTNGLIALVMELDGGANEITLWLLKIIEYGIGICCLLTVVVSAIKAIQKGNYTYILVPVAIILVVNALMLLFVKFVFIFIIAVLLMVVFGISKGWTTIFTLLFADANGTLGSLIAVALAVALTIATFLFGGW